MERKMTPIFDAISRIVGPDLLMLYGDTGSGKSKICHALAKEAVQADRKVIFLDTERNLSQQEIDSLGKAYKYTPIFNEIKDITASLPPGDLVILDSIGLPVLIRYSRMNMRERLYALLEMAAILGDLKDWTFRNNTLAIVTNQPTSEYMPEEARKSGRKVWGLANGREPFGGKSKHVAKEIWYLSRISGDRRGTRILLTAFRSRELASGLIVAEGVITDAGLALDFNLGQPVSDDTVRALLEEMIAANSEAEMEAMGQKIASLKDNLTHEQLAKLRFAYKTEYNRILDRKAAQAETFEVPQELPEEPEEEGAPIEEAKATGKIFEMEDFDELWPYAKAKGIPDGVVHQVLEETGGAVEETLARLKERYGE